jgi:hypothetical protein
MEHIYRLESYNFADDFDPNYDLPNPSEYPVVVEKESTSSPQPNTVMETTSRLGSRGETVTFSRPIPTLMPVRYEKPDEYKKIVALSLKRHIPTDAARVVMANVTFKWNSSDKSAKQTYFLVKYLGRRNFYKLLQTLTMYPVVKDIMQSFIELILKNGLTKFNPHIVSSNTYLQEAQNLAPNVPISLKYLIEEMERARKNQSNDYHSLPSLPPQPPPHVSPSVNNFYSFYYNRILKYLQNIHKQEVELGLSTPDDFTIDQRFITYVSFPLLTIFRNFMFPILDKLCELNQYQETHEYIKNIDFTDLLKRSQPTDAEYQDLERQANKEFKEAAEKIKREEKSMERSSSTVRLRSLAEQRRNFAKSSFNATATKDDFFGGKRKYRKKNRTKTNKKFKNKTKCLTTRHRIKK